MAKVYSSLVKYSVLGALVIGAGYFIYKQIKKIGDGLDIQLQDVSIDGTLLNPEINAILRVNNPTDLSLTFNGLSGVLVSDDLILGSLDLSNYVARTLRPNDVITVPVQFFVQTGNIGKLLEDMNMFPGKKRVLSMEGDMRVNNIKIPFNFDVA